MCRVIAVANQKGGVGKTTTCVNLGIGLAREGKKVLLIEADAQGSMAVSLGIQEPDELDETLVNIMEKLINDKEPEPGEGIIHHEEGVDFIPANIELAGLETSLVNVMSREMVLRQYICGIKKQYDYILIDCMPSLGMITINALVAADRVLIPVEAAYLPVKGLQQLIKTIGRVHRKLNPELSIMGILFTKVDRRTNFAKDIAAQIREVYGNKIHIFANCIPMSVRAAETTAEGKSIYLHDPKGIVAEGYHYLTGEVLDDDTATVIMVDTNIQREDILPSEKAHAYKMKYEAMKHQGSKGEKHTADLVGEAAGESGRTVQRYIRLSFLISRLLDYVDNKRLSMKAGEKLSFLTVEEQEWVLEAIDNAVLTVTDKQAELFKNHSREKTLNQGIIYSVLLQKKEAEIKVTLSAKKVRSYFPPAYTKEQVEEVIYTLLEQWRKKKGKEEQEDAGDTV